MDEDQQSVDSGAVSAPALGPVERRVLGVLVEKGLTTPEYYPMTMKALVAGCNQRSNRDPVTQLGEEEIEGALQRMRSVGLVTSVISTAGRAMRWRQDLGKSLELRGVELGVLGELMLRGAQSVGELRGRANRMRPIADVAELTGILQKLEQHDPPLVQRLSAEGIRRGARYCHTLLTPEEQTEIGAETARSPADGTSEEQPPRERGAGWQEKVSALEQRLASVEKFLAERFDDFEERSARTGEDSSAT